MENLSMEKILLLLASMLILAIFFVAGIGKVSSYNSTVEGLLKKPIFKSLPKFVSQLSIIGVLYFLFIYLTINYMTDNNIIYTNNYINDKRISILENKIVDLAEKFDKIDEKLDRIINFLNSDIKENCDKMGEHIDFVENVYENVKNPLGYLCNKLSYVSGTTQYTLENCKTQDEDDNENEAAEV